MTWKRWSVGQIRQRVFDALGQNRHYKNSDILGLPGTQLDEEVFYDDASFLRQSPFFNKKGINIVAMRASHMPEELAIRFYLVPDRHDELKCWYKVVLMPHVGNGKIDEFLTALRFVCSA